MNSIVLAAGIFFLGALVLARAGALMRRSLERTNQRRIEHQRAMVRAGRLRPEAISGGRRVEDFNA